MYPQHYTGEYVNFDPEEPGASYTIKEAVSRSAKEISLDLVEPDGTQVTLTFESQDGKNFTAPYRRRGDGDGEQVHMVGGPLADGDLIFVRYRLEPDGRVYFATVLLHAE